MVTKGSARKSCRPFSFVPSTFSELLAGGDGVGQFVREVVLAQRDLDLHRPDRRSCPSTSTMRPDGPTAFFARVLD
jgi:hypothetical protein